VSGNETEARNDLFPRKRHHKKVRLAEKFVAVPNSLFGTRPLRLLHSQET
jgi:hypothetical protein